MFPKFPKRIRRPALAAAAWFALCATWVGCRGGSNSDRVRRPAHEPVQALLMPSDTKEARITIERHKTRIGKTTRMLPRSLVASRSKSGVVYRFRERSRPGQWRLAAQLFIDAHPDGAWLRAQYGMGGLPVGAKGSRLLFPWPPKPGTPQKVSYKIRDGRTAKGTVTVLRYGFAREVAGKEYKPCLEVRESLKFGKGGGLDMRTVFCKGFGRVEIETHTDSLSKGKTRLLDRAVKLE